MKVIGGEERLDQLAKEIKIEKMVERAAIIGENVAREVSDFFSRSHTFIESRGSGIVSRDVPNDRYTRSLVKKTIEGKLHAVFDPSNVEVICDETNNTIEMIQDCEIYVTVSVKR